MLAVAASHDHSSMLVKPDQLDEWVAFFEGHIRPDSARMRALFECERFEFVEDTTDPAFVERWLITHRPHLLSAFRSAYVRFRMLQSNNATPSDEEDH